MQKGQTQRNFSDPKLSCCRQKVVKLMYFFFTLNENEWNLSEFWSKCQLSFHFVQHYIHLACLWLLKLSKVLRCSLHPNTISCLLGVSDNLNFFNNNNSIFSAVFNSKMYFGHFLDILDIRLWWNSFFWMSACTLHFHHQTFIDCHQI